MSNTEALGAAAAPVATLGESFSGAFTAPEAGRAPFQARVYSHLVAVTNGDPTDLAERIARFFEEGTELVQSLGLAYGDAQAVVDYVYSRPAGEPRQELGGTMTTLASLATLAGHDMMVCGEAELARTWQPEVFAKIQRKRANRHGRGALPGVDEGAVVKVIVHGGQRPAEPSDPDAPIFRREVLISWPEASDDITPEAVATLQASADAEMKGEAWETVDSPELHTLRDLAHVLDAQIEEGVIIPGGMGLVIAALARVYPDRVHTGSRCQVPECLVHGPCDECPTEVQWARLEGLLMTWLAEHPREVVIHKTQSVGKTEMLLDLRPWQPAGAYPVDGTIIEVEGRPLHMRYCLDKTSRYNATYRLGGWLSAPAGDGGWCTTSAPTGRWRKASLVSAGAADGLPEMVGWQPAGTWPMDGTVIRVWKRGEMKYAPAGRLRGVERPAGWLIWEGTALGGQWVEAEPPTARWRRDTVEA